MVSIWVFGWLSGLLATTVIYDQSNNIYSNIVYEPQCLTRWLATWQAKLTSKLDTVSPRLTAS